MTQSTVGGKPTNWIQPLESNGGVPVNIQDQTSPPFDLYFAEDTGTQTNLDIPTNIGDITIQVVSSAGFSVGDFIGIFGGARYYFATIRLIVANVITVDTPLDFAFSSLVPVVLLNRDMDVSGTLAAPRTFQIRGPASPGQQIDITRFMLAMETTSAPDLDEFGNLAPLDNGLVLRRTDTEYRNIWNIKTNFDFGLHAYDWTRLSVFGGAADGILVRYSFAGADKHGVTIRLAQGETLELLVQDDITGLVKFRCLAEGHEVTD